LFSFFLFLLICYHYSRQKKNDDSAAKLASDIVNKYKPDEKKAKIEQEDR